MNRLNSEKSAYLQQHAMNPVNWWSWSKEAFEEARKLDRMVLVSIGYSTCHWCHVMEHESFEDPEVAEYLNQNFITIKVDREEHPEVDRFYMETLIRLQRSGGWPLNMFVLPDGRPVVGGTYFPKDAFMNSLKQLVHYWKADRSVMETQASQILSTFQKAKPSGTHLNPSELETKLKAWKVLHLRQQLSSYDSLWGGFGQAPKFPRSHTLGALWRGILAEDEKDYSRAAENAVLFTLRCMAMGGLRDHLGGGFHRYSTDREWLAPHFEKMLYDQALLIESYSEAFYKTGDAFYRDIVEETFGYCQGTLLQDNGLYGAGEDADTEKVEGRYYVWTEGELEAVLAIFTEEDRLKFRKLYKTSPDGNWEGKNILRLDPRTSWAEANDPKLRDIRASLLDVRRGRIAPLLDTKAIVSWNALLSISLQKAAFNLRADGELSARLKAAGFQILDNLEKLSGGDLSALPRVYYGTETKGHAYLEDAASLSLAHLYRATLEPTHENREKAQALMTWLNRTFYVGNQWKTSQMDEGVPEHALQEEDGATPGTLSYLAASLLRSARMFEDENFMKQFLELFEKARANLDQYPAIHSYLLGEMDAWSAPLAKIPEAHHQEFFDLVQQGKTFLTGLLVKPHTRFEICSWGQCEFAGDQFTKFVESWKSR
jgi:uncharacterized protein